MRRLTLPAFPSPNVLALTRAPLVKESVSAVILISPPAPTPPPLTKLYVPLGISILSTPSKETAPAALTSIFPAKASGAPNPSAIPARSLLPSVMFKFWALTAIFPPPPARTFTSAPFVRDTSALATCAGTFKLTLLPEASSPTVSPPATAASSTRPPGASSFPPSNLTSPPASIKLLPDRTCSPAVDRFTILPGCCPYCNPRGTLTISKGVFCETLTPNSLPFPNCTAFAVVAKNEPPIFNEAFRPKIIPLGFSKNKFALPLAFIVPSILEIEPPVTRVKIFWMSVELLKNAVSPLKSENSLKLWNRLFPACVPPCIKLLLSLTITIVLTGSVASGTISALLGAIVLRLQKSVPSHNLQVFSFIN